MTHNFTLAWSRSGEAISNAVAQNVVQEDNVDVVVPPSTTNQLQALAVTVANLVALYISSDQNLTILVNSTGSPAETITLTAGKPILWYQGCGWTNPFAANITAFYLTNGGTKAANLKIRFGSSA